MSFTSCCFLWVCLVCLVPLTRSQPANDQCVNYATINLASIGTTTRNAYNMAAVKSVVGSNVVYTVYLRGDTTSATGGTTTSGCSSTYSQKDVWFRISAPSTANSIRFDTCLTSWDTALCVFTCTGTCTSLSDVTYNDDSSTCQTSAGTQSVVTTAFSGGCLTVKVGGYSSYSGQYVLRVTYTCSGSTCDSWPEFGTAPVGPAPGGGGGSGSSSSRLSVGAIVGISLGGFFGFLLFFFLIAVCARASRRPVQASYRPNNVVVMSSKPAQPMMAQPMPMGGTMMKPMYQQPQFQQAPVFNPGPPRQEGVPEGVAGAGSDRPPAFAPGMGMGMVNANHGDGPEGGDAPPPFNPNMTGLPAPGYSTTMASGAAASTDGSVG